MVPVFCPFLAPGEGPLAHGADLFGQIGFLVHNDGAIVKWKMQWIERDLVKSRYVITGTPDLNINVYAIFTIKGVPAEEWMYETGKTQFRRIVKLRNGRVIDVELAKKPR